ncbi:MAG: hypothetical protein H6818_21450 [Phycisphaerales bacterium]|nr:hypothetical protein [Phycisphaerales bacterium]MCB9862357.1 hypothetical protein [Phycisphaerales bacterium]
MTGSPTNSRRLPPMRLNIAVFTSAMAILASQAIAQPSPENAAPSAPHSVRREANQGPVHIVATLASDHVGMASPFELHIRIDAERDVATAMPDYKGILGSFEIVDTKEEKIDCDDLHDCREITMTLRAVIPGETTIPGLLFAYVDSRPKMDGSNRVVQDQIELEPIPIVVENTLAGIKGPASIPMPFSMRLILWALAAIAAIAVAALIARWLMRRPRRIPIAQVVPQLPPYEWAMRELDRLIAEDLIAKGQTQEFYYRINLLLRQYIERRFNVMAGEQTSEEFISGVQSMGALSFEQRETLRAFVAACDPVKYAKQVPSAEDTDWVLNAARDFIDATRQVAFVDQPTSNREEVPA